MTRRSILLLIKSLGRGGAERLLVNAAPYLNRSRFDYSVAYLGFHSELSPDLVDAGIPVTLLQGDKGISWPLRLRSLVRAAAPDLLHVHSPVPAVAARVSLPRHLPLVYTEHGLWQSYHPITYWTNLLTYRRNDHVFCVSEEVRDCVTLPTWAKSLSLPPIEVLHHGLDPAFPEGVAEPAKTRGSLGIAPETPLIGSVAGFKLQKGHPYLLRAFAEVRQRLPDATLLLIGTGGLVEEMKLLATDLQVADSVLFLGNRDDVADLVAALDIFVVASLHEGLPIALLEALALGKPVIATNVGGIPEVLSSEEVGVLVDPRDVVGLADEIFTLLEDPDRRRRMGNRARERAAAFDIRNAVTRMEQVYDELLITAERERRRPA